MAPVITVAEQHGYNEVTGPPAEGAKVLLTPFAEYHEAPKTATPQPPRHPTTVPAIVACGAAALALLITDMLVDQSFIAPQMRGLFLVVIISAAVVGATVWIDRRQIARHREVLAQFKPGDCCAIAWVEGMARRPFPGMGSLEFPPGAQG